jgi:hypothetical protein
VAARLDLLSGSDAARATNHHRHLAMRPRSEDPPPALLAFRPEQGREPPRSHLRHFTGLGRLAPGRPIGSTGPLASTSPSMSEFDPGPSAQLAQLFERVPDPPVESDFWFDWGPIFYRGRLDESARVFRGQRSGGPTDA